MEMKIEQSLTGKKSIYKELSDKANLHTLGKFFRIQTVSLANLVGNKCLMMNSSGPIKTHFHLVGGKILRRPYDLQPLVGRVGGRATCIFSAVDMAK